MSGPAADNENETITIYTIGFAGHTAEQFFAILREARVKKLVDVRLTNVSQLAGFAKRTDLEYFLRTIAGIAYAHETDLAPTKDILDAYRKKEITWEEYEERFNRLLAERQPEQHLRPEDLDGACLLCSEHEPEDCHRRLVAEHFARSWRNVLVKHL